MKIGFYGAVRQVTGSMFLLEFENDFRLLVDCGLDFDKDKEAPQRKRLFDFEASMVNAVVLTHAHLDHSGNLPNLLKEGFEGRIYCTHATYDLTKILLKDSASLNKKAFERFKKAQFKTKRKIPSLDPYALYFEKDVDEVLENFQTANPDKKIKINDDVWITFHTAGHLLGAAHVEIEYRDKGGLRRIVFSGDIGRKKYPLLQDPVDIPGELDFLVCESTYGNRSHSEQQSPEEVLRRVIHETCVEKSGRLVIPAFSIGRTQALLFTLHKLAEAGELPPIKVFTDSPLAMQSTRIYEHYSSWMNKEARDFKKENDYLFDFENLVYLASAEESRALRDHTEPCIIISSSGMIEGGRITQHVLANISNPYCTIMIIGYCTPGTLGYDLINGRKMVYNNGRSYPVEAKIEVTDVFSGHGDLNDLKSFVKKQPSEKLKKIFLVHGEHQAMKDFKNSLIHEGYDQVVIPKKFEEFEL
jgi:metallo-beta-lactamase family protein